ncbi:hypothetical protein V8G54_025853 [Vigna mungo]|uniref:BZIP domain-containing protein n=1 Tax=Vigna mungo TaxID=3915 RepID=A0AAQ3RLI8_VIGMU
MESKDGDDKNEKHLLQHPLMKVGVVVEASSTVVNPQQAQYQIPQQGLMEIYMTPQNIAQSLHTQGSVTSDEHGRKRSTSEDKTFEKRQKRMIKNRESAARSRTRKQAYTIELEYKVSRLEEENQKLRRQKNFNSSGSYRPSSKDDLARLILSHFKKEFWELKLCFDPRSMDQNDTSLVISTKNHTSWSLHVNWPDSQQSSCQVEPLLRPNYSDGTCRRYVDAKLAMPFSQDGRLQVICVEFGQRMVNQKIVNKRWSAKGGWLKVTDQRMVVKMWSTKSGWPRMVSQGSST